MEKSPGIALASLGEEVVSEVTQLEQRAKKFGKAGLVTGAVSVAAVVISGGLYLYSSSVAPNPNWSGVLDIPPELIANLSDTVAYAERVGPSALSGLQDLTEGVRDLFTGPIAFALSIICGIAAVVTGIIRGDLMSGIRMAMPIPMLMFASTIVGTVFGSSSDPQMESERAKFVKAVDRNDSVQLGLLLGNFRPSWAELYVRGQLALEEGGSPSSIRELKNAVDALKARNIEQLGFTPSGKVAYALEQALSQGIDVKKKAANGDVKSPYAVDYYAKSVERSVQSRSAAKGFLWTSGVVSTVAAMFLALRIVLRRRLERLSNLFRT